MIFNCKCGEKYHAEDQHIGRKIKCFKCNEIILLKKSEKLKEREKLKGYDKLLNLEKQQEPEKLKELKKQQELERLRNLKELKEDRLKKLEKFQEFKKQQELERVKNLEKLELERLKSEIEAQNLINQFAKKFGMRASDSDFSNLQMILSNRKYDYKINELKKIVSKKVKHQQLENLKIKIFATEPSGYQECLKVFLHSSQANDDEMLEGLLEFLNEIDLYNGDLNSLKIEIAKIEKEIELQNFERRLSEEDEQIQLENIDHLNGYEFEDFLKNLFSKIGFRVEQTRLSGDQGADLVVVKFGEKTVIQAKRSNGKIGNKAVQEIMAAISLYKAQKGMVVTNNYFTPAAVELANANNIELIDRDALEELINKHW